MAAAKKTKAVEPQKKYELVEADSIEWMGRKLYRIRALVAIAALGVAAGDLGGYVESENNLSQVSGDAWVSGDARVYGNARVYGDAWVSGNAWVYGDARVYGNAQVYGPYPIAVRSDGYTFVLVPTKDDGHLHIIAGCQYRTPADYRVHAEGYTSDAKRGETLRILDFLEAQAAGEKW